SRRASSCPTAGHPPYPCSTIQIPPAGARSRRASRPDASSPGRGITPCDVGPGAAAEQPFENSRQLRDRNPDLLHRVALPDRHAAITRLALGGVANRLNVYRHTVGRANFVLTSIEATDGRGVVL